MDNDAGLNEYELERDRRIARNLETLKRLGIACAATDGLHAKLSSYRPSVAGPALKRPKLQKAIESPPVPTRLSKRLRGDVAPGAEEIKSAIEKEDETVDHKSGSRRGLTLDLDGAPVHPPFTLRSIGTTVWELGDIYRGPWAQRFWSNKGCLYHHAYPVGYRASKSQFGRTYQMEILAGPQGPVFSVTEEKSGKAYSGPSPTSPWTMVCVGLRTGQRISGPLYFGFSDAVTMRAIAALYTPEELAAAKQLQRVGNKQLTDEEKAAEEFRGVEGVGEAVGMALAHTASLGGSRHQGLESLRDWAAASQQNRKQLQHFLLESEEMPAATRRWPAWRQRLVHKVLHSLCGDEEHELPAATTEAPADGDREAERRQPRSKEEGIKTGRRNSGNKENSRAAKATPGEKAKNQKAQTAPGETARLRGSSRQRKANPRFADFVH